MWSDGGGFDHEADLADDKLVSSTSQEPHLSRRLTPATAPACRRVVVPVTKRFSVRNQAVSLDSYQETLDYRDKSARRTPGHPQLSWIKDPRPPDPLSRTTAG
jgi:hypothetical protein